MNILTFRKVYDELARWQKYAYGCNELGKYLLTKLDFPLAKSNRNTQSSIPFDSGSFAVLSHLYSRHSSGPTCP